MSVFVKRRPTICMPHWDVQFATLLNKRNYRVVGVNGLKDADIVCFTDGPAVSPLLYGESKLAALKCSLSRDREDNSAFRQLSRKTPKVGIGRGAHFLNVMNGGSAWQLVDNHVGLHKTTDLLTNRDVELSSNHEQLMLPNDDADLVCITDVARNFNSSGVELRREWINHPIDVEVCYYGHTNSLCFQPDAQHGHEGTLTYLETLMHECLILKDRSKSCEPDNYGVV